MRFRCKIYDIKTFAAAISALKQASRRAVLHLSHEKVRVIAPQLDRASAGTATGTTSAANTTGGVDLTAACQVQPVNDTCVWTYFETKQIFGDGFKIESVDNNNIYIEIPDIVQFAAALKTCEKNFERSCQIEINLRKNKINEGGAGFDYSAADNNNGNNNNSSYGYQNNNNSNNRRIDNDNDDDEASGHLLSVANDLHFSKLAQMREDNGEKAMLERYTPIFRLVQTADNRQALVLTQAQIRNDINDTTQQDYYYEIPVRCISKQNFDILVKEPPKSTSRFRIQRFDLAALSLLIDRLRSCRVSHVRVGIEAHLDKEVTIPPQDLEQGNLAGRKAVTEIYHGGGSLTLQARSNNLEFFADISMGAATSSHNNNNDSFLGSNNNNNNSDDSLIDSLVVYERNHKKEHYLRNRGGKLVWQDGDNFKIYNDFVKKQQLQQQNGEDGAGGGGSVGEFYDLDESVSATMQQRQQDNAGKIFVFDRRPVNCNRCNDTIGDALKKKQQQQDNNNNNRRRQRDGMNNEILLLDNNEDSDNSNNSDPTNNNNGNVQYYTTRDKIKKFFRNHENLPDDDEGCLFSMITEIGIELKYLTKVIACCRETTPRTVEWVFLPGKGFVFVLHITKMARMVFHVSGANINETEM